MSSRSPVQLADHQWKQEKFYPWAILTIICGTIITGCAAFGLETQNQLLLPPLWLFSFSISAGVIAIVLTLVSMGMVSTNALKPGVMIIFASIIFVLFLTGLVATALQLYGPSGSISADCQSYILAHPVEGPSLTTLAWLHQRSLCKSASLSTNTFVA